MALICLLLCLLLCFALPALLCSALLSCSALLLCSPALLSCSALLLCSALLCSCLPSALLCSALKRKWEAKKEYFLQYKKDGCPPPCIDLDTALQGFDIDNTAAYQAIEDSKALHARRWQTKEGMYLIKRQAEFKASAVQC